MPHKPQALTVRIPRIWQWFAVLTIAASWVLSFGYMAVAFIGGYGPTGGYLIFELSYTVLPLLWFAMALYFAWAKYHGWLQRLCVAGIIALIGNLAFSTLYSAEELLRLKLSSPNVGDSPPSWLVSYGYQLLAELLGLVVFGVVLFTVRKQRKAS